MSTGVGCRSDPDQPFASGVALSSQFPPTYDFVLANVDGPDFYNVDVYLSGKSDGPPIAFAGRLGHGGGAGCRTNEEPARVPDDVVVSWQVHDGDPYQRQAVHIAGIVDPAHFDQGRVWLVFVHGRWEARPVSDAQSADARRHGKSGVPDDPTPGAQPQK